MSERSVSFEGRVSGDGACFCWDDVPREQYDDIVGPDDDPATAEYCSLYPHSLHVALGCVADKRYRVTFKVEELDDEDY